MKRLFMGIGIGIFLGFMASGMAAVATVAVIANSGFTPALVKTTDYKAANSYEFDCRLTHIRTMNGEYLLVRGTSEGRHVSGGTLMLFSRRGNVSISSVVAKWGAVYAPPLYSDSRDAANTCSRTANDQRIVGDIVLY